MQRFLSKRVGLVGVILSTIVRSILQGQAQAAFFAARASRHQGKSEWAAAHRSWSSALALLNLAPSPKPELVARYRLQQAMCEFFLGRLAEAGEHLEAAGDVFADARVWPEYMLLQARLVRRKDNHAAMTLLRQGIRLAPDDTAMLYEFGSVALDSPDPAEALPIVERLVALSPTDMSFSLLAMDIAERSGHWPRARDEMRRLLELEQHGIELYRRLIAHSARIGDVATAKRDVLAYSRVEPTELALWQLMIDIYEKAGKLAKARLICRFLMRRWPHSVWHKLKYAELLAADGKLNEADGVLSAIPVGPENDAVYTLALWGVARRAGARHEALARLAHLRSETAFDLETEIAFGYALADVEGPEPAREHFYALAIRTRFAKRVLHGLAHMAVRERQAAATLAAWRRAFEVHPDDAYALCEYARSLFETGDAKKAIALCRNALDRLSADRGFLEFFVWLSTAVGAFAETFEFCRQQLPRYYNPWQFIECGAICAGYLGRSETFLAELAQIDLMVGYLEDVQRFYTIMRVASLTNHEARLRGTLKLTGDALADHPWLGAFADTSVETGERPDKASRLSQQLYANTRYEAMVGGRTLASFKTLTEPEVEAILVKPGRGARKILIFSRFEQARGGSELHALDLAERLREYAEVELWAPTMCHSSFIKAGLVRVIDPSNGELPTPDGIVVLCGLYFDLGPYLAQIKPYRILALYNTFEAPLAVHRIEAFHGWGRVPVELLYCSEMMGNELGLPGLFEPSPTDLQAFQPSETKPDRFVLGRHSRDVIEKHHPEDARVYEAVAALGGRSVLLGGVSMRGIFGEIDGLELLPATSKGIPDYLQSLSCYYYRTGTWVEPWGRVVIEALACGLPVVAHRVGGYAEVIEHGVNGFLFDTTDEAIGYIERLATDPGLRASMGREARISAERIVGPAAMRRLAAFYLFKPRVDAHHVEQI